MAEPMYGYVILEWSQASARPRIADDELYDTEAEALDQAAVLREEARSIGRGERYTVHPLDDEIAGADQ